MTKEEMKAKYPFGEFRETVMGHPMFDGYSVHCRYEGKTPLCMKCGTAMVDRSQFKLVGKKGNYHWEPRKSKGYDSAWSCPNCNPNGCEPLAVGMSGGFRGLAV